MTITVKLDAALEAQLRRRAAMGGCTTSEVIRSALQAYLAMQDRAMPPSAYSLGQDLFGRHQGARELASQRKQALADALAERHQRRGR
jgi:Arc/MetJ-type ribon-helix-helix transcriptional regulator